MLHNEKTIKQFLQMVGKNVAVTIRSSPETLIHGVFSTFDFSEGQRLITVDCNHDGQMAIINWDDISLIKMEMDQP